MNSEQLSSVQEFDETAIFFLASPAQQKLEVSYNTRFLYFRQDFQIVIDGVYLESGISESELEQGKTYQLPDGITVKIKFIGNRVVVWKDGDLIPLNNMENNRHVDPWKNVTLAMYVGGGICLLAGVIRFFSFSDVDFLSLAFWTGTTSFILLGVVLLVCGYAGQYQQKLWALWLGNGILLMLLIGWFYTTFWMDQENFRITRIFSAAAFVFIAIEQVENTRKALVKLKQ